MGLLLHPADLLLDFGVFAVLCVAAALLLNVLASRAYRAGKGRLPKDDGVDHAQRRKGTRVYYPRVRRFSRANVTS